MVDARQYFNERGFTRAIFSHNGMYLAPSEGKVNVVKRLHSWKINVDSGHCQNSVASFHFASLKKQPQAT
jgi:hypothetical protein